MPRPQRHGTPPGHGGTPPGHGGMPPGHGGMPPGHDGTPPGHGGTPPGHGGTPPGHGGPPPGHGGPPPGHGGPPPGHGGPPPGHGGPPPGHGGPPPGHGGPPPGHGGPPPGHGGPPPGHGGPPQGFAGPQGDPAYPGAPSGPPPQPWNPGGGGSPPGQLKDPGPEQMGMDGFQRFSGYEQVGAFGAQAPMPPPPPPPAPSGPPPNMDFDDIAALNEEECRDAMVQFVSEHCCYGKKPAQEHTIEKIEPSSALHYILETFCEARTTGYTHEPYRGQPIDGPQNGMPPPPWSIPCHPDQQFADSMKRLEVPHTATVKICHRCYGQGFIRCSACHGSGRTQCGFCNGSGSRLESDGQGGQRRVPCHCCNGSGKRSCGHCGGDGRITCNVCNGFRQLKCYIQLVVRFKNHKQDYILGKTDLPNDLVRHVQGTNIFQQTMPQVWPIVAYPVREINENSVRLVESHRSAFPSERRLNQRQTLRAVPVTEVHYSWRDTRTRYWVYGREKRVHSPDYPQQCCWGCIIL